MIKIYRQDRMSIYMTFDKEGNNNLIEAFKVIYNNQMYKLNVKFDMAVVNMKKEKMGERTIILEKDNSIEGSIISMSNNDLIWKIDNEYVDMGLELFKNCKDKGCFIPAEFIRTQVPKNKNLDYMYCELVNVI